MTPEILAKRMEIVQALLAVARDILVSEPIQDIGKRLLALTQSYVATEIDDVREALQAEIEDRLDEVNLKLNEACSGCSAVEQEEDEYVWVKWNPLEKVHAQPCPDGLVMVVQTCAADTGGYYYWWLKANNKASSRVYDSGHRPTYQQAQAAAIAAYKAREARATYEQP